MVFISTQLNERQYLISQWEVHDTLTLYLQRVSDPVLIQVLILYTRMIEIAMK